MNLRHRPDPTPPPLPPPPAPTLRPADEVDEARAALAALVPCPPTAPLLKLVATLAARLEGHDNCAQLIHPASGTIGAIEAAARCLAVLDGLTPLQRRAVTQILAMEVDVAGAPT